MLWGLERLSGVLTSLLLSQEARSPCWLLRGSFSVSTSKGVLRLLCSKVSRSYGAGTSRLSGGPVLQSWMRGSLISRRMLWIFTRWPSRS